MEYNRKLMKKITYILLILLSFAACRKTSDYTTPAMTIINCDNPADVELNDLVDSVMYVALETTENNLISHIRWAKYADGHYFISDDRNNLFSFDERGRFVARLGNVGRAGNEYAYIDTFFIDRQQRLVGVVCNFYQRILYYGYDGTFSHSVALDNADANICDAVSLGDGKVLAYYPFPNDVKGTSPQYRLLTEHDGTMKSETLMPPAPVSSGGMLYTTVHNPAVMFGGQYYALVAISHEIYTLRDGRMEPAIVVDAPNTTPDKRLLKKLKESDNIFDLIKNMHLTGHSVGLTRAEADNDYLFILLDNTYTVIWDGKCSCIIRNIHDTYLDLQIFGGVACGGWSDDHIGYFNADVLCKDRYARLPDDGGLGTIVRTLREDDNPVLYRYRFKKDLTERFH